MLTPHRYPAGHGFRRFQLSGTHTPIWLIDVAGKFVSSWVK
jgi:hypothetical protein